MIFRGPKISCNHFKICTKRSYHKEMCKHLNADELANSEDTEQTAPLGAVCSGSSLFANSTAFVLVKVAFVTVWSSSALFAQTYLSKNIGSLLYITNNFHHYKIKVFFIHSEPPHLDLQYLQIQLLLHLARSLSSLGCVSSLPVHRFDLMGTINNLSLRLVIVISTHDRFLWSIDQNYLSIIIKYQIPTWSILLG